MRISMNLRVAWLAIICYFCNVYSHIRLEAPEEHHLLSAYESPSFLRTAVESPPVDSFIGELGRISMAPRFGDIFLPLRSAVENIPSVNEKTIAELKDHSSGKHFIRDAVESVPVEDKDDEEFQEEEQYSNIKKSEIDMIVPVKLVETINSEVEIFHQREPWFKDDKYAAYVLPISYTDHKHAVSPQPYRSDSPFQQLVEAAEFRDFHQEEKTPLFFDRLTNADNKYKERPYGALAQIKFPNSKDFQKSFNTSPEVLCYITNWAFYRQAIGQFIPERLNKKLCTKIIYSFASLDPDHLNIKEFDPWVDIDNQFYKRVVSSGIPVLIALGGWTDSAGDKYSRLASDEIRRRVFASNVVGFLRRHGFSGLHLDWNYPKCWQSDCSKGPASDKPNLTKLVREIRSEFDRVEKKFKLGVAISGYKEIITEAYELADLSKLVDYLTVMTYDYHGAWEGQTGHVSPLYGRKRDRYPQYNTDYTMQLLLKLGAKRERIIMSIPFYGQTFTLEKDYTTLVGEGVRSQGPGDAGEITKQPGMLAYYEICQRIRKGKWLVGRDAERKAGPFAMLRNQWASFEDAASVEAKARYAVNMGFAGVAAWTIDLDDFQNRCCSESFPLLSAINRALGRLNTPPPTQVNCIHPPEPATPIPPVMTTISSDGSSHAQHTTSNIVQTTQRMSTVAPTTTTTTKKPTTTRSTTTFRTTRLPLTPTPSPTPDDRPTTIPTPAVVRPVLQISNCTAGQFFGDRMNCNAYYQCVMPGELHKQYCPGGLHWNRQNKICDWPAAAKCVPSRKKPNTTYKPIVPTERTSTTAFYWTTSRPFKPINHQTTSRPTSQCNEGAYYTHRHCSKYYICVNGALVPNSCGGNLHWDAIRKTCDWPENVKCITTKHYLRLVQSKAVPEDPCNGEEMVPYPDDCTKFLFCLWNRFQAGECGPGSHFNAETGMCDWPTSARCTNDSSSGGQTNEIESRPLEPRPAPTTHKPSTTTTPSSITHLTQKPSLEPLSGYYKIVCYFTNWAWYRRGLGRYTPDDIDTNLCTHIVYGFAVLDYSDLVLRTHDSWADIDNSFYTRVSSLKSKGIKVSLALGGWNDSQGDKYSRLVRSSVARTRFVRHAVGFLERYGFEGLDLDWEYPVCWQTECRKGTPDEKDGFAALVQELSEAFAPRGLLLSAAVSPSKKIIDEGYDVPVLSKYFDWIAVMTYDFHGQWDKKTGHVAPLLYHPDDDIEYFNTNFSINYWIEKGAPSRKLVLGMPLYGQSFTLENVYNNGLNSKASGPGQAGEFTRAPGFLAYYEICDRINHQNWKVVQDKLGRMGPYAFKGNQWVSYDDPRMIRKKAQLIRILNLGGGMVWALDLDDFRNRCGEGIHPLLTQIRNVLRNAPSDFESTFVCYFTNWAWYRQNGGKYLPEDIDADLCSHIVYGFAVLNRETLTIQPHDSWADLDNHFYERVVSYRSKGIKVSVAIGGWNDSSGDKYARLVRSAAARLRFITNVIDFIEKYGFEGLDFDWEYPVCWQVDCKKGNPEEKEGFKQLISELSEAFKAKHWLLSAAVSPNKKVIDAGYDVTKLSEYLDWIAVMTYDYHGQWDKKTGHVAPMYNYPGDVENFNVNFSINYWLEKGAERKKLIMGMPMYGQSFTLAQASEHGLNAPSYGGGEAGEATRARGFLSYYEICTYIQKRGWNVVRDPRGRMGPYAFLRDQWVSFDDAPMIQHKSEYIKAMGLGGAMIWALDLDDFKNVCNCESYPLLKAINRILRNYSEPQPNCMLEKRDKTMIADYEGRPLAPTRKPSVDTSAVSQVVSLKPTKPIQTFVNSPRECHGKSYASHQYDCNKYYICQYGEFVEQKCPSGLHWNKNYCDWPQSSKCAIRNVETTSETLYPLIITHKSTKKPSIVLNKKPAYRPKPAPGLTFSDDSHNFKVICYFTNWAWYRSGQGKFIPENIDENLCTHIIYGFTVLNNNTLTIKTHDVWTDIDNRFYERIVAYKKKGIRVTVAIGGWSDSLGNKYARLVSNPQARKRFIESVLEFIEKYGFEGLDLDWEYPVCWQVDCSKGSKTEKASFVALVRELHEAFKPRFLLLSAAVSPSKMVIDTGYDVPILAHYFDWISVMTYDFHGHWDKKTGHVAPLYSMTGDNNYNGNFSVNYWIAKGAPPHKLVMGMPLYGQSFTLAENSKCSLKNTTLGPGRAGTYTRARGFLSYYEICEQINNGGWRVMRDSEGRIGPYACRDNQWVSYDDVEDIRRKSQYIKRMHLGGGMVWALDLDDFRGRCGCGRYPLLRTINHELRGFPGQKINNCT
uniref:chitinase n=1 Tax=Glossina brevipalpis TaxID=37001 RepID=A0A1A9WKD4_9MUSC